MGRNKRKQKIPKQWAQSNESHELPKIEDLAFFNEELSLFAPNNHNFDSQSYSKKRKKREYPSVNFTENLRNAGVRGKKLPSITCVIDQEHLRFFSSSDGIDVYLQKAPSMAGKDAEVDITFSQHSSTDGAVMTMTKPCSAVFGVDQKVATALYDLGAARWMSLEVGLHSSKEVGMDSCSLQPRLLASAFDCAEPDLDPPISRPILRALSSVLHWLYPRELNEARCTEERSLDFAEGLEAQELYSLIERRGTIGFQHSSAMVADCKMLKIEGLLPTLRLYQSKAVEWMIKQETRNREELIPHATREECANLLGFVRLGNGQDGDLDLFWFNPFTAALSATVPQEAAAMGRLSRVMPGGILADEMGLGKTVEVLGCILLNRFQGIYPSSAAENGDKSMPSISSSASPQCGGASETCDTSSVSDTSDPSPKDGEASRVEAEEPVVRCLCGRTTVGKGQADLGWVQCEGPSCGQWMHARCAGFHSLQEAEEALHYTCLLCELIEAKKSPTSAKSTLVVCPPSILYQWQDEITKHSKPGSVTVHIFNGVNETLNQTSDADRLQKLSPSFLAGFDVVLTTFDCLRTEVKRAWDAEVAGHRGPNNIALRRQKRYRVLPSPLLCLRWWRVCLDEAQMIEAPTAESSRMALKIPTHHRWAVSGTPIGRGRIEDLYGLVLFLHIQPFCQRSWWAHAIQRPCEMGSKKGIGRLLNILEVIMWRTPKNKVLDQIGLPEQHSCPRQLQFSTVEQHFYRKQHNSCAAIAHRLLNHQDRDWGEALDKLARPLLTLRQACCHPQLGGAGIKVGQNQVLSMDQILDRLVDEERGKCEEAQRKCLMNYAALGAIAAINARRAQQNLPGTSLPSTQLWAESSRWYETALKLVESNRTAGPLTGEVKISGSEGFKEKILGTASFEFYWESMDSDQKPAASTREFSKQSSHWAVFEFGSPKRLQELHIVFDQKTSMDPKPQHQIFEMQLQAMENGVFCDILKGNINHTCEQQVFAAPGNVKSRFWRIFIEFESTRKKLPAENTPFSDFVLKIQLKEAEINADPLQVLHLSQNLSWVSLRLGENGPGGRLKRRIQELEKRAKQLRDEYISERRDRHLGHMYQFKVFSGKVEEAQNEFNSKSILFKGKWKIRSSWWEAIINHIEDWSSKRKTVAEEQDFISGIKGQLSGQLSQGSAGRIANFEDTFGLKLILQSKLDEMDALYKSLGAEMMALSTEFKDSDILQNSECGRCRQDWGKKGPECNHCLLERRIELYTSYFFIHRQSKQEADENEPVVSLGDDAVALSVVRTEAFMEESPLLRALRYILRWATSRSKQYSVSGSDSYGSIDSDSASFFPEACTLGALFIKIFERKQLELKQMRRLWRTHYDLLSGMDELTQAVEPLRLTTDDKEYYSLTEEQRRMVLLEAEIEVRREEFHTELVVAKSELERAQGQLLYLRNILQQRASALKECPVCWDPLGKEVAVTGCGHFLCVPCIKVLLAKKGGPNQNFKCVKCREVTQASQIHYATELNQQDGSQSQDKDVKGSWGTKVCSLVADVMRLRGGEKCLIFSQWDEMLNIVEAALRANNIRFERLRGKRSFQQSLHNFRCCIDIPCLLLPIKSGAQGLTLVEATHVFLLEPVINPAIEEQAINRVHRIGQTEHTFVHRYIVKSTIEERIEALKSKRIKQESDRRKTVVSPSKLKDEALTVEDIKVLFD